MYITDRFDDEVARRLSAGQVGFMPSDTIYGLSAIALNEAAVNAIFAIKQRDDNKPCIVLISDWLQLDLLNVNKEAIKLAKKLWPAPLTVETPATEDTPHYLHRGTGRFGIRMPERADLRNLIRKTGPIISTSANTQGRDPATDLKEAQNYFGEKLDFIVDQGRITGSSSTLITIYGNKASIVRQGDYTLTA